MSNFGFGFNRGQFGGGMRFPFGGGGAAGQGGFQPRPFQGGMQVQQPPGIPGLQSGYRNLLHRPNQPPAQQIQQAARPMVPPATRGAGGAFGAGAAIQGDVNGAGRLARPLMNSPAAFGGFLSVPPEPVRPTMPPTGNAGASSSFANTPDRTWTPREAMQYQLMERRQGMMDANPNFRDNLAGSMDRDRQIVENTMPPDVNDPNFQPITSEQSFQQIPGNRFDVMQDRFNRIKANQPPTQPLMTASQATSTMPNYQQRLAQADPRVSGIVNDGYAMSDADNRITPMPRVSTINGVPQPSRLSETERARIGAVGGSAREWEAKSKWMAERGHTQYTPEVAQAYTAEQQQKRFARNEQDMLARQRMNAESDYDQQRKLYRQNLQFQANNPLLYSGDPSLIGAQLAASMAGAPITQFQQQGLTPAQQTSAELNSIQNQVQLIQQEPNEDKRAEMIAAMKQGQNIIGGNGVGTAQAPRVPLLPPTMPMFGPGGQVANQQVPNTPPGRPPLSPRESAERSQGTPQEVKFDIMRKWADAGHTPTQQEMDMAGISPGDIQSFHNDNGYGPFNMLDWTMDLFPVTGDYTTSKRNKRYGWAGDRLK